MQCVNTTRSIINKCAITICTTELTIQKGLPTQGDIHTPIKVNCFIVRVNQGRIQAVAIVAKANVRFLVLL